jgi:LacI family transcriptional regulator
MKDRVTLIDIARAVGCAKSTVSMALRGDHAIQASTRRKIEKASRRLGYRPNPLLASLGSRRFHSRGKSNDVPIAFIQADLPELKAKVSLEEAMELAPKLGYRPTTYTLTELFAMRDPSRVLHHRGIQGILLAPFLDPSVLPRMDWTLFSVVAMGHPLNPDSPSTATGFNRVTFDHHESVVGAWERARAAGYHRIGAIFCRHEHRIRDDDIRYAAMLLCQEEAPKSHRVPIFNQGIIFGQPCDLRPWLERYRPDLVIGMNPWALRDIREAGWRVPEDVALICLHKADIPGTYPEDRTVAGFVQDRAEVPVALELLDQEIRLRYRGLRNLFRTVMLHHRWIDGNSFPAPRRRN